MSVAATPLQRYPGHGALCKHGRVLLATPIMEAPANGLGARFSKKALQQPRWPGYSDLAARATARRRRCFRSDARLPRSEILLHAQSSSGPCPCWHQDALQRVGTVAHAGALQFAPQNLAHFRHKLFAIIDNMLHGVVFGSATWASAAVAKPSRTRAFHHAASTS